MTQDIWVFFGVCWRPWIPAGDGEENEKRRDWVTQDKSEKGQQCVKDLECRRTSSQNTISEKRTGPFNCILFVLMARTDKKERGMQMEVGRGSRTLLFPPHRVCIVLITAVWSARTSMEDSLSWCPLPNFPRLFWKPLHTWFVRYAGGMWYGRLDFTHLQYYSYTDVTTMWRPRIGNGLAVKVKEKWEVWKKGTWQTCCN